MLTIKAYFFHGATAECQCATLAELVEYLTQWMPMAIRVVCREADTESEE